MTNGMTGAPASENCEYFVWGVDGRGVLVEITAAGRDVAGRATDLLNREVFGRPELTSPRMVELVDVLRDLRRSAGDFDA